VHELTQANQSRRGSREIVYALFGPAGSGSFDPGPESPDSADRAGDMPGTIRKSVNPAAEFARCFSLLANLPNYALDRRSRYEANLWRQASQILFVLDALDRRKPWDRKRRFRLDSRPGVLAYDPEQ
jgi:hypothetical protein